jgi:methionyl-tRNA formyltransferase
VNGALQATPQDAAQATLAPPLEREHGLIDWSRKARAIHDLVRGLAPRPSAFTTLAGQRLRVTATRLVTPVPPLGAGVVRVERPRVLVGTGDVALELVRAQLEGKRELAALDLVNGRALADDLVLGGS